MADATTAISKADALSLFQEGLISEGQDRQFDAQPNPEQRRSFRATAVDEFTRDLPAASGSAFGRNVAKGFLNIGTTSLGFFEALSDILGAKGAKAFYKEKGDRLSELNAAIPVEIESVTDIGSFADAGGYAAMAVGQLAPQIATALLGGLTARGLAAGRSAFTQLAATIGGTVVPSTIQESGGIYRGTRDETGVEAPLTSLALGSVSGALEAITPARFLLKVLTTGTDELKKKAAGSLLRQTAKEIIKSGGTEMGTEVAQESIALAANKFADSTYKLMTPQNAWRIVDAGLMGLVGGAALGSIEPTVERAINHVKQQEESNATKIRTQQENDSEERERIGSQLQADSQNRSVASEVAAAGTTPIGGDSDAQGGQATVAPVTEAPAPGPAGAIAPKNPADMTPEEHTERYPVVASNTTVDGRTIRNPDKIANMSSIGSSLDDYEILPGIREVPMSDFTFTGRHYSVEGQNRIDALANSIQASGEISPLIVVRDKEGAYVLEGATRAEAIFKLGAKSFPAKVVLDLESIRGKAGEIAPSVAAQTVAPTPVLQTIPEFKSRVTASNLSPEAKVFINAFLDSKAAKYLEGARFRIAETLDNGWQGSYWQGLIQLAETAAPGVAPQEFMHRIFDLLPVNDRASIGVLRQRRLQELKSQFPNDPLLASIVAQPTSTAEFVAANPTDQQITDFYPVINNDEFFANMMSDKFTGAVKNKPTLTLVGRIREVLKDVIAAIKKAFKLPVTADQMFKNIMAGRYDVKPVSTVLEQPRGAVLPITRKETIQKVAYFAKPGELPTEALLATGQVTSPRNILERILSALPQALRDKAGQILGFRRMDDISQYVAIGLGQSPSDYATTRAALPDEGTRNLHAVHSNRQLEMFEQEGEKTRAAFLRQQKEILSPAFASKFRTLFKLKTKEEATRDARQAIELTIKNGLDKAIRRVREAGANDALFESADNERLFYESLSGRTAELLSEMQAIVQGPTFPGTLAASTTPTASEILAHYYQAVPRPAPNSVTGRNERAAVQRIAAEILSRSKVLRDRMLAAFWSESNELLKPVSNVEEQVVRDIQTKNPATVIGKLVRDAGSLNRVEGRAAFVFLQKHREMTRKLLQFEEFQAAVQTFDAVMADPEYRALRTLVSKDAKAEVRPVGAQGIELGTPFYSKGEIYLPSGEIVTLNMFPDKARFDAELGSKLSPALDELNTWLMDPDNQDSPTCAFYQRQYNQFKTLWWSSSALSTSKQVVAFRNTVFKLMDSLLGMAGPMLKSIGTRNVVLVKSAMAIWKDSNHYMNDWLAKWHPRIVEANGKAAKSHPSIWKGQDRGAAVNEWHAKVFTPLAASRQDPARMGYKVGDVIPESGETVTAEDMAVLQLQSVAGREAYQVDILKGRRGVPLPNLVEDRFIPGAKFFRTPTPATANVVTRRYNQSGRTVADSFVALLKDPQSSTADKVVFWNNHFEYVKSAVVNRNAQYSTLTDFESSLEAATQEIASGAITNVQELIDFIHGHSSETEEAITNWLFGELGKHARALANEIKGIPNLLNLETVEHANPFTVGRGLQVAPPAWYSYGFSDSPSIANFSMSGSSFYFEILIKSLGGLKESLAAEIDRANAELDTLAAKMGRSKAQSTQRKQNREDMRLGQQTADLENLQDFHRGLEKLILDLNQRFSPGGKRLEEDFGLANKAWSGILGGILSSVNTLTRNAFEGGFVHNGFLMSRLFGSTLQGFPRAFFGLMQSLIKVGASGLWSLPRAALKLHPFAGVSSLITSRNLIEAERTMFGDAMTELATTMYGRIQMFRDLESAGLGMPAYPNELLAASAQFPLTFGQITERPYADTAFGRLLQSIGPAALSMIDAQISLFLRPTLPRAGDQIANLAVANTTLGAINTLEARLRKLFSVYRSAGKNAASLTGHIFTPTEILGRWFGLERNQTSLKEIENWFTDSLVPFHDSIVDYFARLETDPGARWLTPEDRLRLATTNVETVNLATPENRPLAFRKNLFMRVIGALMGWNVKMLSNSIGFFTGIAASDPRYSQTQLRIAVYTMFLATLAWSALGQSGIEEILRFLSRTLNDEERPTRQPWEQEGAGDQLKGWTIYAFNSIPFVATAANVAFSDLPNKAGFSPTLLAQQKVIDVLNYAAGAVRTRDITYRLPQTIRGFLPIAPILLNRLPSTAGSVEALNVRRLYTRYGDADLIRKSIGSGAPGLGSTATRLTPYGDRIINALAKGDFDEAQQIKTEAVKVATGMGKVDPERSVEQMITARLPHRRAFKETLSHGQMVNVLAKMGQGEREQVEKLNSTLKAGLGRLGIETDFVEPEKPARLAIGAGGYGGRSGLRSLRPSAFGRRSRRPRLVGSATGRRRRGLGGRRKNRLRALI